MEDHMELTEEESAELIAAVDHEAWDLMANVFHGHKVETMLLTCSECGKLLDPDDGLAFVCGACWPALAFESAEA